MASENKLVEVENLELILSSDLGLYRDIIQWGAILFSHNLTNAPDSVLIEMYYEWLGKIPISNSTRAVSNFFLGFCRELPMAPINFFDAPIYINKQDEGKIKFNHESPFLSESVGLTQHDVADLREIDAKNFNIVNKACKWFREGRTLEQVCVLSYLAGLGFYKSQIGRLH